MNSSDELPWPITTSRILQRVAGFFFFKTRCRKRKFILLQASNPRGKTPTKYSKKRGKKEKKTQCLHLVAKKAHDYLTDWCKEWHKKILPRPSAIEDNSYLSRPQTQERKTLQTKCSKKKKKKGARNPIPSPCCEKDDEYHQLVSSRLQLCIPLAQFLHLLHTTQKEMVLAFLVRMTLLLALPRQVHRLHPTLIQGDEQLHTRISCS